MDLSTKEALQLFVTRLLRHSDLNDEEQSAICGLPFQKFAVGRRQDFVRIDDRTTTCCLVVSGLVVSFGQNTRGDRQITAAHLPGNMADLHSAVRPTVAGGLSALNDAVVLRFSHDAIRAIAARYPAIAEAFWRDCMLDASILVRWLTNIGRHDAQTRLAHLLCEMAIRTAADCGPQMQYALPFTQELLGDAASLTSVHVNRSLKALGELVTFRKGMVTIHDWAKLAKAGEFDPTYLVADTGRHRPARLALAPWTAPAPAQISLHV